MTDEGLLALLEEAAQRGAELALERIGLEDKEAAKDIRELREIASGWRAARKTVIDQFLRWLVIAILGAIAGAVYLTYGGHK